jgi:hypothetical protein
MPELVVVCPPDVEVYQGFDEQEAKQWAVTNARMSGQVIITVNLTNDESVHATTLHCTNGKTVTVYQDGRIVIDN